MIHLRRDAGPNGRGATGSEPRGRGAAAPPYYFNIERYNETEKCQRFQYEKMTYGVLQYTQYHKYLFTRYWHFLKKSRAFPKTFIYFFHRYQNKQYNEFRLYQ